MSRFDYLKTRIESELKESYPDMVVYVTDNHQTLTELNYKHNGQRSYAGMVEGKITVFWGKFYDRICGNGWMFGNDWLFKFDSKDGSCKYDGYPETVDLAVEKFIERLKSSSK